ncbi:MAG: glycerophosphoryl diester phosphodiesterase [Propionibacteriaceae bacterium]|jgi:glycerophosphoryl diester phosphodiesterase|nr:glycerophosphoryl diester phosphodiesterase [Propionibacteriaceae bacterium]
MPNYPLAPVTGPSQRRVFGHRGLPSQCPENTLVSFNRAADVGAKWIETDVDVLADGTISICHDWTLDRTTNMAGSYNSLTAVDLEKIDAGSWFGPEFAGEPLPTLPQLIQVLNNRGLNANIEIKANTAGISAVRPFIDGLSAALEKLDPEREVIISSFNWLILAEVKRALPQYPVACLWETVAFYDDWRTSLELTGAEYAHLENTGLTKERVEAIREAGFRVNVWTVNEPARANELFNWGVDGIFTDYADKMTRIFPQ